MAPKSTSQSHQVSQTLLPEWVITAGKNIFDRASGMVRNDKATPIIGDPFNSFALNRIMGLLPQINREMGTGTSLIKESARGIGSVDRSAYQNPFDKDVLEASLMDMTRAKDLALLDTASQKTRAGTFGGSRHGVAEGVIGSEFARDYGRQSADLRKAGFDTVSQLIASDLDRKASAGGSLVSAAAQRAGINLGGLSQLASLGDSRRQIMQSRIDQPRTRGIENINLLLSTLGMVPYNKKEIIDRQDESSSGVDFGMLGGGIFQTLMGLSDRREKTDIKKVGVDKGTKLPIYAFRYKGDPKTYPKMVGPMAQDVKKLFPERVAEVGGRLAIRFGA